MSQVILDMPVFEDVTDRRAQALKVLEEAAELCEAAKGYTKDIGYGERAEQFGREQMLSEFADVLQTLANLAAAFDVSSEEINVAVGECIERNTVRRRY